MIRGGTAPLNLDLQRIRRRIELKLMKHCVIPGTFDPPTLGHLDMIERASRLFEKVTVLLLINEQKSAMFTLPQRTEFLESSIKGLANVGIDSYGGLLADYLSKHELCCVVRGVRNSSDFNAEMLYFTANRAFYPEIEILLMPTAPEYAHISSTLTREIIRYKGEAGRFVPASVFEKIKIICNYPQKTQ